MQSTNLGLEVYTRNFVSVGISRTDEEAMHVFGPEQESKETYFRVTFPNVTRNLVSYSNCIATYVTETLDGTLFNCQVNGSSSYSCCILPMSKENLVNS